MLFDVKGWNLKKEIKNEPETGSSEATAKPSKQARRKAAKRARQEGDTVTALARSQEPEIQSLAQQLGITTNGAGKKEKQRGSNKRKKAQTGRISPGEEQPLTVEEGEKAPIKKRKRGAEKRAAAKVAAANVVAVESTDDPAVAPEVTGYECNKVHPQPPQTPAATRDPDLSRMSVHQRQMAKKLQGARFRWINEQLYTAEGSNSYDLFQKQPQTFNDYHLGFRAQVEHWPSNPVDIYIADLAKRPTTLVVADMGCGEAKLAQSVPQKVHSFDLVAGNEYITACDIAHTPLPNEEVDLVIFCLALMGTNFLDFIQEAHRILKPK
ncbi:25S rRNA (adenine645-N1)-methyltransferase [Dimargaris cristalligena]|nr:25S rRNA (adenine645-N1)-methyltransferase [Dimargaris cristalligena]